MAANLDRPKVAAPSSLQEYFWCACHNDIKSDMEDVELESLWEDLLQNTGSQLEKIGDGISMDPFLRDGWREAALPTTGLGEDLSAHLKSAQGLVSPRPQGAGKTSGSPTSLGEEEKESSDSPRETIRKKPGVGTRIRSWLLTPPNEMHKERKPSKERCPDDEIRIEMFESTHVVGRGAFSVVTLVGDRVATPRGLHCHVSPLGESFESH